MSVGRREPVTLFESVGASVIDTAVARLVSGCGPSVKFRLRPAIPTVEGPYICQGLLFIVAELPKRNQLNTSNYLIVKQLLPD